MRNVRLSCLAILALAACMTAPQPVTGVQALQAGQLMSAQIASPQEPIAQPLSLYDAMARALRYNLDYRVALMELDVAQADLGLSAYDKLPDIVASGQYYGRSNRAGASSLSLISGRQSLEPSTATEPQFQTASLAASFNILDYGLSTIRHAQIVNEAFISQERSHKATSDILRDVHRAYWRMAAYKRFQDEYAVIERDIQKALENSKGLYDSAKTNPIKALKSYRDVNRLAEQAQRAVEGFETAQIELAKLMGLPPDQSYTVLMPEDKRLPPPLSMSFGAMIELALTQRPEMRETVYAQRITQAEIRKAVLETLPSLEGFTGLNVNSNQFLFNADWVNYGAKASWNIMKVFSLGHRKRKAKTNIELEEQRGVAVAMAVVTQLGISRLRYDILRNEYERQQGDVEAQNKIMAHSQVLFRAGAMSHQTYVQEQLHSLIAQARSDAAYSELQDAAAQIHTALGYGVYEADISARQDLPMMAASLRAYWEGPQGWPAI